MLDSWAGRTIGVVVLLVVLFGLCLGYGLQTSVHATSSLPDADDLGYDASPYIGEMVEVSGVVINTDPVVIAAEYHYYAAGQRHGGVKILTIRGVRHHVAEGATIQVYGVLDSQNAVTAENTVVIPARNYRYMYGVSFIAGLWVLARLLTHWQIDPTKLAITKRTTPIQVSNLGRTDDTQRTDD